jgi:enoyl-CoA hydratase/carnithine racemase
VLGELASADSLELGLVNAVLPDDGFVDHVVEWLQPMVRHPRPALAAAKKAIVDGLRLPLDEGLRLEGRLFIELQTSPEAIELEERASATYRSGGSPGL